LCAIEAEIARGGMGVVYRAHDVALRRVVALKLLREELASDASAVERFLEEARIAGALQHPGIVPIYALGRTETGRPYFTMKLIEGRTLASLLASRSAPQQDARRYLAILEHVCRTVAYAHDRGIVHLDLKPGNVMVGSFGEVQVVDWGLAVLAKRSLAGDARQRASAGSVYGTPAYMPPEQARGESARIDTRADVFALGAILCEILLGEPPYSGGRAATRRDAADARLEDSLARLRTLEPGELGRLCERCLAVEPEARNVTAAEIATTIAHSFSVMEERARAAEIAAAEAQARAAQERRARRLTVALAATALSSILVVGAVWGWIARERAQSRASIESRAREAIQEAAGFLGGAESSADIELYGKAVSAADRARTLLAGTDADPELDHSATAILSRSQEKQAAARVMLETRRIDRELLARIESLRTRTVEFTRAPDFPELDRRYGEAFRAAGLDPDSDPDAFVARTIERGIGTDVAAALDDWSDARTSACLHAGAEHLRALTARIDPDPVRTRARDLMARGSPDEIAQWINAGGSARSRPSTSIAMADAVVDRMDGQGILLLRIYREAQLAHPEDYVVAMSFAQMLYTVPGNQHVEGEHFYRVAHALRPDLASPLLCLAWELEHRNIDCAEAADLDRRATELEPDNRSAYFYLGRALRCMGDFDGSLAAMKQANRLIGFESEVIHKEIATLYRTAHRYDDAIAEYQRVLAITPPHSIARYEYAETLADVGRFDEALVEMERTIADDPLGRAVLVGRKATMLVRRGDGDEAARVLRDSLDAQLEAVLRLREMEARLGDFVDLEPLIARCARQIEKEPEDAEANCRLGALLEASGRFGDALVAFREGHALGSRLPGWTHPSAAWLEQAQRLAALEPIVSAPARRRDPRDAEEAYSLAIIAAREQRWSLAADEFALAFERDPSRADVGLARLEAACAAAECALAASRASDAEDAARARDWRAQALAWMQREIEARRKQVDGAQSLPVVLTTLAAWRAARELASVREVAGLSELPAGERTAWETAWSEIDHLADGARRDWATARR
jgi:serine/threonine-protein kinase